MSSQQTWPQLTHAGMFGVAADADTLHHIRPFSKAPGWLLRIARIAVLSTMLGLQYVYIGSSGYSVMHAVYLFAGLCIGASLLLDQGPRFSPTLIAFVACFTFFSVFSTIISPYSSVITQDASKHLLRVVAAVVCGMAIGNTNDSLRRFLMAILVLSIVSSVIAWAQAATGAFHFLAQSEYHAEAIKRSSRAYGFTTNPNTFAGFLLIPIASLTALMVSKRHQQIRTVAPFLWCFLVVSVLLSGSRSAIAASALAVLFSMGRRFIKPAFLVAGAMGVVFFYFAVEYILPEFFEGVFSRFAASETRSDIRWILLERGLEAYKKSPAFGVGLYGSRIDAFGLGMHNGFLEPFVEIGTLGGLVFQVMVIVGLVNLWKCARITDGTEHGWIWRGMAAGATAYLVSAYFHGSDWRSQWSFALLGIGFVGIRAAKYLQRKQRRFHAAGLLSR
jgi:hypothetical protein